MEAGSRWRIEAVDVIELHRIKALLCTHRDALVQHGLERIKLTEVQPAFLRVSVVNVAQRGRGEDLSRRSVRAVVLPGHVQVANCLRVRQGSRLPAGVDGLYLRGSSQESIDVVDVHSPGPDPLPWRHAADLPVPPHRLTGRVQVWRIPAKLGVPGLARQGRRYRHDPPAEPD